MNLDQLKRIMPDTQRGAVFLGPLNRAMEEFGITSLFDQAAFLANAGHETGQLFTFGENLNYSAERLMAVWPKRFPSIASTAGYARNPVALANKVYANRMGNGDEKSGDGWRCRGAGILQLTGKENHAACAKHFGIPLDQVGDWLRLPEGAARSAAWFYTTHGMLGLNNFDHVCDRINIGRETSYEGDAIGFKDRKAMFDRAMEALA